MGNEYDKQATNFLDKYGLKFSFKDLGYNPPPWDGGDIHGTHYKITLRRENTQPTNVGRTPRSLSFDFWGSHADYEEGDDVRPYSVLACISSDSSCAETFKEFCQDYGYDEDSRKAEKSFNQVSKFAAKLRAFFDEEELEALREIQ